jgi:hypothetical protein
MIYKKFKFEKMSSLNSHRQNSAYNPKSTREKLNTLIRQRQTENSYSKPQINYEDSYRKPLVSIQTSIEPQPIVTRN